MLVRVEWGNDCNLNGLPGKVHAMSHLRYSCVPEWGDVGLVRAAMLIIAMDDVASRQHRMLVMRFMSGLSTRRRCREARWYTNQCRCLQHHLAMANFSEGDEQQSAGRRQVGPYLGSPGQAVYRWGDSRKRHEPPARRGRGQPLSCSSAPRMVLSVAQNRIRTGNSSSASSRAIVVAVMAPTP